MSGRIGARTILAAPLVVSGLLVSGCMGGPTYGTGVSANEQLASDVTNMFSLKPKGPSTAEYAPRPELVKPTKATTELPPPQESITTADASQWPESPEQKRARIRADATENRDKLGWEPELVNDLSVEQSKAKTKPGTSARYAESGVAPVGQQQDLNKQGEEFKRKLALSKQGSPTVRRTLTEPPLEYRQPAATAPTDELGEDEFKKQRRLKAEAKKAGGGTSWRDLVPWL
jgi:hypothetical protein